MAEQFVNEVSPALTLSTAITSTSATTITPSSVTPLPATGTFRIRIDNEYMKASVSGSNLTVTRGDGASTPATHSAGTPIYVIVTKEALDSICTILANGTETANRRALNFIGMTVADNPGNNRVDITAGAGAGIGLASARPGSPSTGQIYVPTDGVISNIYDGTAWQGLYAPKLTIPPTISNWTAVNNTGATFTDVPGGGINMLGKIATGDNNQLLTRSVPSSGSWTRTVGLLAPVFNIGYNRTGVCVYDTVSGKLVEFCIEQNLLAVTRYSTLTSYNSDTKQSPGFGFCPPILWLQVYCDGTNLNYNFSPDGKNWWTLYSEAKTAWGTPNYFGLDVNTNNATWPSMLTCISYLES